MRSTKVGTRSYGFSTGRRCESNGAAPDRHRIDIGQARRPGWRAAGEQQGLPINGSFREELPSTSTVQPQSNAAILNPARTALVFGDDGIVPLQCQSFRSVEDGPPYGNQLILKEKLVAGVGFEPTTFRL